MKRYVKHGMLLIIVVLMAWQTAGCSNSEKASAEEKSGGNSTELSMEDIQTQAKTEGSVISVGMPDSWADWKDTWADITAKYGLTHTDTDMSSAEEIAKFAAEKNKPTADIGDVGMAFAPVAVSQGVTQPYKTSYWKDIPDWAKDSDGHWIVGYQGTIAIMTNLDRVKNPPKSFKDLLKGDYKIAVGDVTKAAQAQNAVLAAALANGGDEKNIEPGIDFFEKLAKKDRISLADVTVANFEKGEIDVALVWDFNGLNYRDHVSGSKYEVVIPKDGSVVSGYATIINKYAPHPNAAKLTREYILSDEGQINLAKGYARPIRDNVKLPSDVADKLIPEKEYKHASPVKDFKAWEKTQQTLPELWQEHVLVHLN